MNEYNDDEIISFAYLQSSKLSSSAKRRVCFLCGGVSLSLMILLLVVLLSGGGKESGGIGAACFIGNCGGGSGGGSTEEEILSMFPSIVPTALSTGSPSVTTVEMISVEVSTRSSHPTFTPTMSPTPSPTLMPAPLPTRLPHPIPTRSLPPTFAPTPQRPSVFVALSALYHSTNGADWTAKHGWMNGTVPCRDTTWLVNICAASAIPAPL